MRVFKFISVFLLISLSSQRALARRDIKAHVHGEAELSLVLDDKNLQLEAKIPMNDLVGFEHKPKTEKQKDLWKQALNKLQNAKRQLELPKDGSCALKEAALEDLEHHHEHDKHDKHHDKHGKHDKHEKHHDKHHKHDKHEKHHDKHHKQDKQDKHGKHDHDDHHDDEHADVRVKYLFQCQNPSAITKVQIKLFKDFPSLKKVSASFVGPKGQGHKLLTSTDNVILLSK